MKTLAVPVLETKAGKSWASYSEEGVEALREGLEMLLFDHWHPYQGTFGNTQRGLLDGPLLLEMARLLSGLAIGSKTNWFEKIRSRLEGLLLSRTKGVRLCLTVGDGQPLGPISTACSISKPPCRGQRRLR
jgi:hypothetical protein